MSPRPRKVSDDEVLAAAHRAMVRLAPAELTLAAIASEAGVTAGALVQRFGSKRNLLLALAEQAAAGTGTLFRQLRADHDSPLQALRAYAECLAGLAGSHEALARNLAYLMTDLMDPGFRKHLVTQARATRAGLRALVASAVEEGEVAARTDSRALARTVESVLGGSMMAWAVTGEGTASRWMRNDLEALLAPYLAQPTKRRRTAR